jgi:hypothetical protein
MMLKEKPKPITKKKIFLRVVMLGLLVPVVFTLCNQTRNFFNKNIAKGFKIDIITFDIEHIYSADLAKNITSFISAKTGQESLLSFDQQAFRHDLKEKFTIITSIDWQYRVPNTLHLKIIGTQPLCLVNNVYILGTKRELFKREYFKDNKNLDVLENITIPDAIRTPLLARKTRSIGANGNSVTNINDLGNNKKNKISKSLFEFISKIPKNRWEQFFITYHKPNRIELSPKKSLFLCKIITDEQSFFDDHKFESINKIVSDLYRKNMLTQKILQTKKPLIYFDMRFDGRIVVKIYDTLRRGTGK